MKKILLSTVAVGSVIAASSAFAADLPSRKTLPAIASQSLWQGAYAGINAGYGVNNINNYYNGTGYFPIDNVTRGIFNSSADYIAGGVAGAQLGYNHVFANHIMAGTEIDLDWADIYNNANPTQTQSSNIYSAPLQSAYFQNSYIRTGLDWIGTARIRIGYDLGRFLPYLTGGFAYGALSHAYAEDFFSAASWGFDRGNGSSVSLGWAAGAGAEYMVADNWSVKGEYLFTSLSGISTPTQAAEGINSQGTSFLASYTDYTGSFCVHQVRVGLNYHPNWWGAAPIVGDSGIYSSSSLASALCTGPRFTGHSDDYNLS